MENNNRITGKKRKRKDKYPVEKRVKTFGSQGTQTSKKVVSRGTQTEETVYPSNDLLKEILQKINFGKEEFPNSVSDYEERLYKSEPNNSKSFIMPI